MPLSEVQDNIKHDHRYENTPKSSKKVLQRVKKSLRKSRARVKILSQHVKRLKVSVSSLRTVISELKKNKMIGDDCAVMLNQYEDFKPQLLKRMSVNTGGSVNRSKYPPELRSFAITLHFYSPKAYNFVRKKFNLALPHPSVIRSWYSSVDANPGFSVECFNALKLKSEQAKQKGEKLICALMVDEMSLKKSCTRSRDGVTRGHVDLGIDSESNDLSDCKDALVFMIVPLKGNWKIPIAYFFINGMSADTKSALIRQALIRLHDVSVEICSLTLDGPPEHFSTVAKLGAVLESTSNTKPFFYHPADKNHKVYVVFDPCHMLKNIRNCIGDLKILKDQENNFIKWEYIENLSALQESEGLRLGNRLRKSHIDYRKMVMKVYLAAQTLSSSVADAIEFCEKVLQLPEFKGSAPTVRFIRAVDRIFDFLNVRNPWGRGYKSPLRTSNEKRWRTKIMEEINYLSQLKLTNDTLLVQSRRKAGFVGFYNAVISVLHIYDKYVKAEKPELNYLLTYKLSQDHLELFFCAIRSRGGWCPNPTAAQFVNAFKQLLIHHEISNSSGNVQGNDIAILNVSSGSFKGAKIDKFDVDVYSDAENKRTIKKYRLDETEPTTLQDEISEFLHLFWAVPDSNVNETSKQCVGYIAGFVIRAIRKKIRCDDCLVACESLPQDPVLNRRNGIALVVQKTRGGLTMPSTSVVNVCLLVESLFRQACKNNNGKPPTEPNFSAVLTARVLKDLIHKTETLFPDLQNHFKDTLVSDNFNSHFHILLKQIITKYIDIRLYAAAKNYSLYITGAKVRNYLSRQIIWARQ